jgi:hypothetical protein
MNQLLLEERCYIKTLVARTRIDFEDRLDSFCVRIRKCLKHQSKDFVDQFVIDMRDFMIKRQAEGEIDLYNRLKEGEAFTLKIMAMNQRMRNS